MNQPENPKTSPAAQSEGKDDGLKAKSKLLWTLVFAVIAIASVSAVVLSVKSFSLSSFIGYISSASPIWLAVAILCMLGYIMFEGLALISICRTFGHRCTLRNGFCYSAADIYFSAITPSATGGQPASALLMIRDGIPGTLVTAALFLNLAMYSLSLIVIGLLCLIIRPGLLLCFSPLTIVFIVFGFVAQIFLCSFFILLLKREQLLHGICDAVLRFLGKIHILRHVDRKRERLDRLINEYRECVALFRGQRMMFVKVFLCNLVQRGLLIATTAITFIACGGAVAEALDIYSLQAYVTIGTNVLPIPGAMGITDYFLLDAFGSVMTEAQAVNLELLSRSLAFYFCVLICGAAVLVKIFIQRKARKRK